MAIENEREILETIRSDDTDKMASLLDASPNVEQLFKSIISIDNPSNHAFGRSATLLQYASFRPDRSKEVASLLVERGATLDLHSACGLGKTKQIEQILADTPEAKNEQVDSYFPVQFAIAAKQAESIARLMQSGDDPNKDLRKVAYFGWEDETIDTDYQPWKPIHMASLWGFDATRIPVAKCLIENGADLNAVSPLDGFRPIHLVAMPNRVDMIRFFVENGIDVDSRTEQCKIIVTSKENSGPIRGFGCTPLMVACGEGFVEATECLLELGADINAVNDDGKTALDFAEQRFWNGQPYDQVIKVLTG